MSITDESIEEDVKAQLIWDYRLNGSHIDVDVGNNKVILSGEVPSFIAKGAAEADVWTIEGVMGVQNKLEVKEPSETSEMSNIDKIAYATSLLSRNLNTTLRNVDITVEDGTMKISGEVDAYWKKDEAETILYRIPGVIRVENNLVIVPTESLVDKEIAEGIMASVSRNYLISNENLDIEVKDGKVILSGSVPNPISYFELMKIVKNSPGVIEIEEDLVIERLLTSTAS